MPKKVRWEKNQREPLKWPFFVKKNKRKLQNWTFLGKKAKKSPQNQVFWTSVAPPPGPWNTLVEVGWKNGPLCTNFLDPLCPEFIIPWRKISFMTNFSSNIVAKNDDKSYLFLFFAFHFGIYDTNLCSKSGFPAFFGIKCPFFHQTFTQKSHFRPPYLRPKNSEKLRVWMRHHKKKRLKY